MDARRNIVDDILYLLTLGLLPVGKKVDDVDKAHKSISRMLSREHVKDKIMISKDREKGMLWFSRRK